MSKNFFQNWRGEFTDAFSQNQWARAQGSSLSEEEIATLGHGGIVLHKKSPQAIKVFAREAGGTLWSVIVPAKKLAKLKNDLANAGFVVK